MHAELELDRSESLQVGSDSICEASKVRVTTPNDNIVVELSLEDYRALLDCLNDGLGDSCLVDADVGGVKEDLGHHKSIIFHLHYLLVFLEDVVWLPNESLLHSFVVRQHVFV